MQSVELTEFVITDVIRDNLLEHAFRPLTAASTHSYTAKCTQEINFKAQP